MGEKNASEESKPTEKSDADLLAEIEERKAELERRQAEAEEKKKSEENPETVGKSDNELMREIEERREELERREKEEEEREKEETRREEEFSKVIEMNFKEEKITFHNYLSKVYHLNLNFNNFFIFQLLLKGLLL